MTLVNILYYEKENGRTPFLDWFNHLETLTQAIIAREIDKVSEFISHIPLMIVF